MKRPYKSAVVRAPSVDFADMLPKPSSYGEALAAAEEPIPSTFPVKHVKKADGSIFPAQEYDWSDIGKRLEPLVGRVIENIKK